MIKSTKNYEMFIFREDNREKIDQVHVKRIKDSIELRNLLDLRPIVVNEKYEILDGQHRLLAAKSLGVEIFYQIEKKLEAQDIIAMNINKAWTNGDFLNFYCQHGYPEYLKLKEFMKKNGITLKIAISIAIGQAKIGFHDFKIGNFVFHEESLGYELDICWETINYIKKMNGFSSYTMSSRFWKALLKLIRHPYFDQKKWRDNMQKMIEHFSPRARAEDYVHMVQTVYNWRNQSKIDLME